MCSAGYSETTRLACDEPAVAAGMLARRVNLLGKRHTETAATLAMLVVAHLGDGDLDAATEAVSRLRSIAELQERGPAAALATLAEARVAGARGRQGVALHFTINVAQPRPLSDNQVVEMRRRRWRSGNGKADLRVERVPRRLY